MADFISSIISSFDYIKEILPALLEGTQFTVKLFALTLLLSIPLGLPFALGSISKFWPIKIICKTYIWLFRGTPLMLQLFFFYFFLPIAMDVRLDSFTTAVITFVLNYAAYFAEIYRAGIESIDRGQHEAARSLGVSKTRTMFDIILPQTIKRVLPPVSNEAITLVKDTALVSAIGVGELLKAARGAVNRDVNVTAYAIAAAIYLVLTFVLTLISRWLEKHFSKYEARGD
ncbi:MAG TPA: amino acid ABC transporter permease [Clostridiales bacterium]|nr:amino acid ABC transporter permease [Clostridiales bacterium]